MNVEKLMTVEDLANVLGTSAKQVRNMRTRGQLLPPLDLPGVQLRWRRVDVENWIAGRSTASSEGGS